MFINTFNPDFGIEFNFLVFNASLNKIMFQFLCLSNISVLSCTKLVRVVLGSNLPLFWKGEDDVSSDECKDAIANKCCTVV